MTSLEAVIAEFLRDLTLAQDSANRLSARLSLKYRHHTILRFFPVPNALLDDVDVTFRFVFDSPELGADPRASADRLQTEVLVPPSRQLGADASAAAASLAMPELAALLARASEASAGAVPPWTAKEAEAVREELIRELMPRFHELALRHYLGADIPDLENQATAAVRDGVRRAFADAPDEVRRALDAVDPREAGALAAAMIRGGSDGGDEPDPLQSHTRIRIAAADVAGFPDFAVQTLRLRARLRNYKWVIVEGDLSHDQLLPEN
ncbi:MULTISPECIES: hypothetical protein [unclassified Bradyrhizobium]|uniref:hypothetical protein n=1 Tax=unclassified Bradyrhizobium TaxID=2631580 RepID=UPI0028F06007|nr:MULTISPECIES: hypothetical protein [unclassified Bradyrhizobium]